LQYHHTDQEVIMTVITINRAVSEEFLSDVLITAFDAAYGGAWDWFEPVPRDNDLGSWLVTKHDHGHTSRDNPWLSVNVRLRRHEEFLTGNPVFDSPEGFLIDHQSVAGAISRIVNDDYLNVWREPTEAELERYCNGTLHREWRLNDDGALEIFTHETASGIRRELAMALNEEDAGLIDATMADAIAQVAAFGKVIFS
jgi:hypothetical protein